MKWTQIQIQKHLAITPTTGSFQKQDDQDEPDFAVNRMRTNQSKSKMEDRETHKIGGRYLKNRDLSKIQCLVHIHEPAEKAKIGRLLHGEEEIKHKIK